ncbi:hypothetical protein BVRB_6g155500 [Beta vulgaris subsp. vulgaris]|uniref:Glycosyltransferase n=1 Tax=Beta vulgaris subsp. vulgaris TaxID=3555 RepID=A0A0J8B8V3_BETVV|nr:hypothetical protein BVRB_6g155500 [Beta vulgaris subsp. vulgaris]
MGENKESQVLKVAFYPWFALGHLTSFLRLANKLAERGHQVSYFLPKNTQLKLASQNHFPDHLTFIPITVPSVDGLPPGAETTNDVSLSGAHLIMAAMDMTRDTIDAHLALLKPDFVFYDFAYWMPQLARKHGIKSVHYITGLIARYTLAISRITGAYPPDLSSPIFQMRAHEMKVMEHISEKPFAPGGVTLPEMFRISFEECDAVGVKTCKEMEGIYCEFAEKTLDKPVLLAGPVVPKLPSSKLDDYVDAWLSTFGSGTVIFCALGSECILEQNQFQDILLGLELTGKPFLAALKPPKNCKSLESGLPEGFSERVRGRGMIHGGWVQQQLILQHPSVGCFITHCGVGSLSEAMVSQCQVVLMPQAVDQFMNARQMSLELKIGVEVESTETDGFFTREALCKAVSLVMDEQSEVAREVKANHAKWRDFILTEGLEDSYISSFIQSLQHLLQMN